VQVIQSHRKMKNKKQHATRSSPQNLIFIKNELRRNSTSLYVAFFETVYQSTVKNVTYNGETRTPEAITYGDEEGSRHQA
jgi:hypothetical protein